MVLGPKTPWHYACNDFGLSATPDFKIPLEGGGMVAAAAPCLHPQQRWKKALALRLVLFPHQKRSGTTPGTMCLAGWLAGWQAGRLAGWQAGRLEK